MRHALAGFVLLLLSGAVHAQDFTSGEYCNPFCLRHGFASPPDCSFHNFAQCEATRRGVGGSCIENPFLSMCTRGQAARQPVNRGRRRRR